MKQFPHDVGLNIGGFRYASIMAPTIEIALKDNFVRLAIVNPKKWILQMKKLASAYSKIKEPRTVGDTIDLIYFSTACNPTGNQ